VAAIDPLAAVGLKSGLILAIDDEGQIRTAMAELLQSWGHRVVVAADGAEALAMLDKQAGPDLIICDYRLRDGANGVDVIRALRDEFGRGVPALLVTGETAAENLREAVASGFPLLHKPLSHARLRAAVTSLIRRPVPIRAAG
jgi:CheY-like chemotaxis protein